MRLVLCPFCGGVSIKVTRSFRCFIIVHCFLCILFSESTISRLLITYIVHYLHVYLHVHVYCLCLSYILQGRVVTNTVKSFVDEEAMVYVKTKVLHGPHLNRGTL